MTKSSLVPAAALMFLLLLNPASAQTPAPRQPPPAPPDLTTPPADAVKTASGLMHKLLSPGTSETRPKPTDMVVVHYTGWTADGKAFDSTAYRGRPSTVFVNGVIPGWVEGLQLMTLGEKRRFWVPEALAFKGQEGRPKGTIVFDIELLEISPSPAVPPPDVAAPPPDATKTRSGLAYRILRPGTGTVHPRRNSRVTVHYTGWTTDGKMFDSSVVRGQPATFGLDQVIEGWTEGVQLMLAGEKTRFWIPEGLAYRGMEGKPRGMLVFDVELIEIAK